MFPIRHYHILFFYLPRRKYSTLIPTKEVLFIYNLLIFSFLLVVRVNAVFRRSLLQSARTSRCVKADLLADLKFSSESIFHSWGESKENPQSSRSLVSSCVQLLLCPEPGTDLAADSLGRVAVSSSLTRSDHRISWSTLIHLLLSQHPLEIN